MNKLIERYVYDVVRRLPEKSRADVEKELYANIADMLPENPTQENVEHALVSLGAPSKMAEQYRAKPRYLISPAIFDDYLAVLKLVISILAVVFVILKLFGTVLGAPADGNYGLLFSKIVNDVLGSLFSAVTTGFLWVTLGFAAADYFNVVNGAKPWSVKDLPDMPPKDSVKISRVETVIGAVLSVVFMVVMIRYQSLLGWYESGTDGVSLPLFNSLAVSRYIPYLVALTMLSCGVAVMKYCYARWNYLVATVAGINSVLWTAASILFIKGADTFNPAFLAHFAKVLNISQAALNTHWQTGITAVCLLAIFGTAVDIISSLLKARKGRNLLI